MTPLISVTGPKTEQGGYKVAAYLSATRLAYHYA